MNEELIERLFIEAQKQITSKTTKDFANKFTELIVRECADTVTDRCEMRNESDEKRAAYYANRIKEHFGVEE